MLLPPKDREAEEQASFCLIPAILCRKGRFYMFGFKKLFALLLALGMAFMLSSCAPAESPGKVYYLSFKPEADAAWQALARRYTALTGVSVTVVTAASGAYSQTLTAEMDKGRNAPTLFQCSNQASLQTWRDYMLDLSHADFVQQMTRTDFNLYGAQGELLAVGYCYEAYGLIVNKALLRKTGHTLEEITGFAALKAVAEDIHAHAEALGFDAFTSSGLDSTSAWRFSGHLVSVPLAYEFLDDGVTAQPAAIRGAYMDELKSIWDLYIHNAATMPAELATATGDQAQAEFGEGKAVFYQNGTWEYASLVDADQYAMDPADLAMIPIYIGAADEEKYGLACGTENRWAVNARASQNDIQATLDFLYWVVTSDEGTQMMAEQFGPIPFKAAKATDNAFLNSADAYTASGRAILPWAFTYTPNTEAWRAGVTDALMQYCAGGSWDHVVQAIVQGWAAAYQSQ